MSLKDRIITVDDVRALSPDTDPTMYVAADWIGVISDIFNVNAVSISGRLWCVTQFLEEPYSRLMCLNALKAAQAYASLGDRDFLNNSFINYQAYINGNYSLAEIESAVLAENEAAAANLNPDTTSSAWKYARLIWAYRWACKAMPYRQYCWYSLQDVALIYMHDATPDAGMLAFKQIFLDILNAHP